MDYRNRTPSGFTTDAITPTYDEGLRSFLLGVYNYMASALALTGATAYLAAHYAPLMNALYRVQDGHMALTSLGWVAMIAPLLFVFGLSAGINRMSLPAAQGIFWAYAAVMGLSLSTIFFAYTGQSIMRVFFITAIMFGSASMWGYVTKKDLTGMGHFLMMGVWGIIIASFVNFLVGSSAIQFAVSIAGVGIFTGLAAYDTQKLKSVYYQVAGNAEAAGKYAIMGAVTLYLDFINLFMFMLRLMGDRR